MDNGIGVSEEEMIQAQWTEVESWLAKAPATAEAMQAAKTSDIIGIRINCDQWAQLTMSLVSNDSVKSHAVVAKLGELATRCSDEIDARIPSRGSVLN